MAITTQQGLNHTVDDQFIHSERKLLSLFMQAPAAIALLEGPHLRFAFANPLYQQLFGRREEELIGHKLAEVFKEVKGQGIIELFEEVLASGQPYVAHEFPASFKENGEERFGFYNFVIQPIKNDRGEITDLMVHAYEVTKQVRAHKQLEESEHLLQLIADALPLLISYVDKDLRYRFNNHAYERWFGHRKSEIYGKTMAEVLGEKAYANILPKLKHVLAGEQTRFEGLLDYGSGGVRYVVADYIPHVNDQKQTLGFFVVVNDITERVQSEKKLIDSENRFRHLIESNIIGVLFWDLDGEVTGANNAFLKRFGYTHDDFKEGLSWKQLTPEIWREKDLKGVQEILATGHHMPYEKQYYHKDGTAVDVIIGSSAFEGSNNRQGVTFVVDISERKKMESVLRESEARYTSIVKSEQIGLVFTTLEGHLAEANDAYLRMIGYTAEEMKDRKLNVRSFTPMEHHTEYDRSAKQLLNSGEASPYEIQYITKDERRIDVWVGGISFVNGNRDLVVSCVLNITDRKDSERALRQSEGRFAAAVNALQGILWTNNPEGAMEGRQPGWEDLTGQSFDEYQGFGWAKAVHPEDAQPTIDAWNKAVQKKSIFEFEHRLRLKSGAWGTFSIRAIPVIHADGSVREWVGVHTDITSQRDAQKALAYRTALLEAHHEASVDGILLVDTKGKIISFNQSFARLWNFPDEVINSRDDEAALKHALTQLVHPEQFLERVRWLYSHPIETALDELEFLDGRIVERHGYPVFGPERQFYAWSWTFRDITKQKRFAEQLEKLVRERTEQLEQSNEDLQQFAHVASHDLKEPVRKIKTFMSRLQAEYASAVPERAQRYMGKVQHAADRMVAMIEGVLNYSTVNAPAFQPEPIDLNTVLAEIESDLEVIIGETRTKLVYSNLPVINGSRVLVYQLFYNLINNAIKFSRENASPVVTISEKGKIEGPFPAVIIEVADNGIGFDEEDAAVIFNTFTRLHSKDKYEGTGLGLALVRKIAERHRARITAKGVKGKGASFTIEWPL